MNDIRMAINTLKLANELSGIDKSEIDYMDNSHLYKANLTAIIALEKQIPKRAKETQEMMDVEYICPICGKVNHNRGRYCWGCGQAITH